eukprot:15473022-Alexandrium_andersonii.AAC.1
MKWVDGSDPGDGDADGHITMTATTVAMQTIAALSAIWLNPRVATPCSVPITDMLRQLLTSVNEAVTIITEAPERG